MMKPGMICQPNQEIALGIVPSIFPHLTKDRQKLSSIWKYKSPGLLVSVIERENDVTLFVIHSHGSGWITYNDRNFKPHYEFISIL